MVADTESPSRTGPVGIYGASPIKRKRRRRTNAEIEEINQAIIRIMAADHPMTLRGLFYRIPAATLRALVRDAITRHIDPDILAATEETERLERATLYDILQTFGGVA